MSGLEFVGLASNVVQFVEFGVKVSRKAKALYDSTSGATIDGEALEADTVRLTGLVEQVKQSRAASKTQAHSMSSSSADLALWVAAASCEEAANDLIALLNNLKIKSQSRNRFGRAVVQAFKGEFSEARIQQAEKRLMKLEKTLFSAVQVVSMDQQSAILAVLRELRTKDDAHDIRCTAELEKLVKDKMRVKDKMLVAKSEPRERQRTLAELAELEGILSTFAIKAAHASKQQDILASLRFPTLRQRHNSIKDAHKVTFNWVLGQEDNKANFAAWLESPVKDIYWVQGKAGSGKSTLMKALVARNDTKTLLRRWAGSDPLFIASHFFWAAGNLMQQSILGLVQTLLFQIFRQCPELISITCASRWASFSRQDWMEPWDQDELTTAIESVASQQELAVKFCFFIDGLDEYTDGAKRYRGTFEELAGLLQRLASSSSIKVCVSSRPWPVLLKAFGLGKWQLRLEDLTRNDIRLYVQKRLGNNIDFQRMSRDDTRCAEIAPTIVKRADGVFLWVSLVVEQILKGLSNCDDYKILKARLDSLPDTLDEYFSHMLTSIEPVYWEETNRIFRLMVAAGQAIPLLSVKFLLKEMENPDFSLDMEIKPYSWESLNEINRTEKARIQARCHDLLYVGSNKSWNPYHKVDFLHRTVKDFFEQANTLDSISTAKSRSGEAADFDPFVSLCRIYLALSKAIWYHPPGGQEDTEISQDFDFDFAGALMHYAWHVEVRIDTGIRDKESPGSARRPRQDQEDSQKQHILTVAALLDELDRTKTHLFDKHSSTHWTNKRPLKSQDPNKTFLALAIQARLSSYVEQKLGESPRTVIAQKQGRPLLDYALRPDSASPISINLSPWPPGPVDKIVELLLEQGAADPNLRFAIFNNKSPWELFLGEWLQVKELPLAPEFAGALADTMCHLIRHGADIDASIYTDRSVGRLNVLDVARVIGTSAARIDSLQQLINEKRAENMRKKKNQSIFSKIPLLNWIR